MRHNSSSNVTEPRIATTLLYCSKPVAKGIEYAHHTYPNHINNRQRKSPSWRVRDGKLTDRERFEHPIYVSVTCIAHDDRDEMDKWNVQQEVEHRHFAKDPRRTQ